LLGRDGVKLREAQVGAVEAVGLIDGLQALVAGLDECDVDALSRGRLVFCKKGPDEGHFIPKTMRRRVAQSPRSGSWRCRLP
jgi:hypothetical protein